ncbi:MAG: hypothetical protein IJI22_00900 [Bacilli bacterium]|nr:hypothetical protein [Bacilli bacterium]
MEEKKKITLPIKIIIIGCIIGLVVSGFGGFKQVKANKTNEERKQAALKESEEAVAKANARLKEIEEEYYPLKDQLEKKEQECDAMSMSDSDWFEKHSKCQREVSELNQRVINLEMEDDAIKNADYTRYYQKVKPMSYQIFYIIGASIAGLAILGAFIIYLVKGKKTY